MVLVRDVTRPTVRALREPVPTSEEHRIAMAAHRPTEKGCPIGRHDPRARYPRSSRGRPLQRVRHHRQRLPVLAEDLLVRPAVVRVAAGPGRLLIADDIGVGKTIEASLIALALLDRRCRSHVQGLTSVSELAVVCLPAGVTPVGIPVWNPPMVALHSHDGRDTQEAFGSPLWGLSRDRWVSESWRHAEAA